MIPLKYSLRNLRARWTNTLMIVFGIALVVWSSCLLFGLVEGLQHILKVSGDPLGLVVLRKGSTDETNGGYTEAQADDIATLNGISRSDGSPLVAKEMVNIAIAERNEGTRTNLIIRGVSKASPQLRPNFTILPGGRMFEPGKGECVVSKSIARRFKNATLGSQLPLGDRESYRVVGLFTAGGSAAESEVWVDFGDMARNLNRTGYVSTVRLRAASPADRDRIQKTINDNVQFKLDAKTEVEYYESQASAGLLFQVGGTLIAVLLTFGAMFAAANTMYAAVSSRTREIGTLRALGFSRFDILISFLGEALILCVMGGVLGLLATIPLSALTFSTALNFADAAVAFRFGPIVLTVATLMTLAMGLFGGLFPAVRAVRLDIVRALREL
ncbi:MAG: ABC transporter permease [Isosphaeraceae bacterium]